MPIIQLHHVRKVYDTKVAVEDLSFTVEPGTMFGLLGPNGSGKTSSIRMMIGITVPDSGSVSIFGKPFSRKALARIGYLPEERGLYKKMKVLDQLVFLGRLHYITASASEQKARAWCEKLHISEALHKKTEDLSKGMQQKIQFIAALLHEPELIIMDEPFTGLDPVNAALLMDTLMALRAEGRTILFSTHRMDQVEKFCDGIALISRGRLVLSGSMRSIKSRYPRNRIKVDFAGNDDFLQHPAILESRQFAGVTELTLSSEDAAQQVLAAAVGAGTVINSFEIHEPSLEEIFIEEVKKSFGETEAVEA